MKRSPLPPKIGIRADAAPNIGIGHLRRSLSLASAFRELGATVRFVTGHRGHSSVAMIEGAGFVASLLPEGTPDAGGTIAALEDWSPDRVIVDSYEHGSIWHSQVRNGLGCPVAAIDDIADRDFDVDVLVDHNLVPDARVKYGGRLPPGARLLSGPRFALLGPAFRSAQPIDVTDRVGSIGIFMGGYDQTGIAPMALDAVRDSGFAGPVEIVSASGDSRLANLRDAIAADGNAMLLLDLPDLAGFFARHDLQIGAGGGATWERCCLGVPSVLVVTAPNQLAVVPLLQQAGVVLASEPTREALGAALARVLGDASVRHTMARAGHALVDGRGAERVALAILGDRLEVRDATAADCELTHRWRNDEATRSVSREGADIAIGDHKVWFERTLADPSRRLLIGMIGPRPVGVIRFDRIDDSSTEVSLYLDPGLYGLGLGHHLLAAGEQAAAAGLDIVAEVLEGNTGSARLFESSGYIRVNPGHYRKSGYQPAGEV